MLSRRRIISDDGGGGLHGAEYPGIDAASTAGGVVY
jgi:hypothetical protein